MLCIYKSNTILSLYAYFFSLPMKPSLVLVLLSLLMPPVLAGLTAIVESPPLSDPQAEFHRFDLYLSSHGNFAIDADSLGDNHWILAVPSAFRKNSILSAKEETLSPRVVTCQTIPDASSLVGRSLRVTYEINTSRRGLGIPYRSSESRPRSSPCEGYLRRHCGRHRFPHGRVAPSPSESLHHPLSIDRRVE